jgi:DegV family protein with EDD domain
MRENMVCKFIIDNLEYLKMGGRISEAQAMIGKFLNIKPILTMDDGRLRLENKVRGRKKAIKWIVNWIKENRLELEDKIVSIYHSNDYEYFKQLRDTITDNFSVKELIEGEVGAVVGTHAGPGCVAVAFIK